MSTLSSSAKILGLARTIVSTTNHSGGHLAKTFRELAASLAASSRSKLLFQKNPRSVSTASQLVNEDDAHLGSLLESIQIPVQHLWQKRNQTALDVDIKRFRNSSNSIYGETPPQTMRTLLSILQEDHNGGRLFEGNFMDVGSGNGAAIVCAAMTGRFHESKGIEYDETRHQEAILLQDAYQRKKVKKDRNEVHLVKGDIGHFPELLDDASVVFCNSVVFDPELSAAVGKMLDLNEKLAFPRIVVSVSRRFPCPTFNLVDVFKMFSNTGKEFTFFVQQKQQLIASSPAVSDSLEMVYLLKEEELFRALVEMAVDDSKEENKHDRMAVLSAIGMSESGTRVLLKNKNFLSSMASQMFRIEDLPSRASSSMVLRAVASFPVGRRVIAESDTVMDALLANVSTSIAQKDHPAIRANVLDILGQVLQDSVGQEIITRDIDDWLQANMDLAHKEGWEEVIGACLEIQMMQRWWKGELRYRIE